MRPGLYMKGNPAWTMFGIPFIGPMNWPMNGGLRLGCSGVIWSSGKMTLVDLALKNDLDSDGNEPGSTLL